MDQGIKDHEVHFRNWLKDLLKDKPEIRDNYVMACARDDALAQVIDKLLAQLKEYEKGQGPKIRILENQVERLTAEVDKEKHNAKWWELEAHKNATKLAELKERETNIEKGLFMGKPIEYWTTLEAQADANGGIRLINEVMQLRSELYSFHRKYVLSEWDKPQPITSFCSPDYVAIWNRILTPAEIKAWQFAHPDRVEVPKQRGVK